MFVAHHLVALDKQFSLRLQKSKMDSSVVLCLAQLCDMVPRIRKIGNDNFTQHIVMKKQHLCDYLMMADGEWGLTSVGGQTVGGDVQYLLPTHN